MTQISPQKDAVTKQTAQVSFAERAVQQCPFAAYDELRTASPVYRDPITGNFVLTRYDDIRKTLINAKTFSSKTGLGSTRDTGAKESVQRIYAERGWQPMDTLISNDPPSHHFYRQLVDRAFTPSKIEQIEPRINEIIEELVDQFADRSEVEFLSQFAIKLPMFVIAEQLGVDKRDMDRFKLWSDVSVESQDPTMTFERELESAHILTDMQQYMAAAIDRLRANPDGMLLSRLIHAEVDGRHLDLRELMSILQQLLVAGNETTTTTLAAGLKLMIDYPELVDQLHAEPDLMRNFVEEALRVMSPIQTLFRRSTEATEIRGVAIPAGSIVEVRFGAGNRDPMVYDQPSRPDLRRTNSGSHLAFGTGRHLCIGNQLARGELRLAFKILVRRFKNFRASRGEASYDYTSLYIAYGLTKLWVQFDQR